MFINTLPETFQDSIAYSPPNILRQALTLTRAYDSVPMFRDSVRAMAADGRFSDSASLPEGTLQALMPPIYEMQSNQFFVSGIPVNPLQAPGADKLTYTRVNYYGEMTFSQAEAEATKGLVDIGMENVELTTKRPTGYFRISNTEVDRLSFYARNNNVVGAINLIQQKRESAIRAYFKLRDEIICRGKPAAGLVGLMSSGDVDEIPLSTGFTASNTPDQNVAVLAMAFGAIVRATDGVYSPTTLVLPPNTRVALGSQARSTNSDKTVLQFWKETCETVLFDNGTGTFEIAQSSLLEDFRSGFDGALMMCRRLDCVEQIVPKDITYSNPIPFRGGYEIEFHADVTSVAIKQPKSLVRLVWPNT